MESIEKIKQLIQPVLEQNEIELYEAKWLNEKKSKILQIAIMKKNGSMDLDTCALMSEKISEILDDVITMQYLLEVCSPGAEREIKDLNELANLIDKHVFVRLNHSVNKKNEFTGDIVRADEVITLSYRDKAVLKKIDFKKEEIEFIRLAVKI